MGRFQLSPGVGRGPGGAEATEGDGEPLHGPHRREAMLRAADPWVPVR